MPAGSPIIHHNPNFQDINAPDFSSPERSLDPVRAELGGLLVREQTRGFELNFNTIVVSTVIFLSILAWYDYLQTTFYVWLQPETQTDQPSPANKLYYALLSTLVTFLICGLIYLYANKKGI